VSVDEKLSVLLLRPQLCIPRSADSSIVPAAAALLLLLLLLLLCLSAEPVFVSVDEKLTVLLSKTGGLESLEVQGTMSLIVGSDADAYVAVQVRFLFSSV
jgi:hypothetical protein